MAGYIGVDNKARKISKIFVGVDGKAHDVRKVYVGNAEGKAEPVWSYMPIVRKGNGPSLRAGTYSAGATPVGNYAIIAGGTRSYVDSFSDALVRQTLSSLKYALDIDMNCATFKNNKYAVFAGGARYTSSSMYVYSYVYTYNEKLTQSSLSSLSVARTSGGGESVGDYVIFVGGENKNLDEINAADCYNSSLTKVSITTPGVGLSNQMHGHTESHAIFFGGNTSTSGGKIRVVYDKNLTMSKTTDGFGLFESRGATIDDKYALFPISSDYYKDGLPTGNLKSFAYTDNLTEISIQPTKNDTAATEYCSASFGSYAIFAGGYSRYGNFNIDTTSVYDSYLTYLDSDPVGDKYTFCSNMSRIGTSNYCILAGGMDDSDYGTSRTDIFELIY